MSEASDATSRLSFTQAPRQKLSETVAQQILDVVRDQPAGTRLQSERELASSLGVGRSTLREALQGLAMIGVVEIRHGQGVFVGSRAPADPTSSMSDGVADDTRALLEARPVIEVELARLAAIRRTDQEVTAIDATLNEHAKELDKNRAPVLQASQFHIQVAEAARSPILSNALKPLFLVTTEHGPNLYEEVDGYVGWELDEHRGIFLAIEEQDSDLAAERMANHVNAMVDHYRAWLAGPEASGDAKHATS